MEVQGQLAGVSSLCLAQVPDSGRKSAASSFTYGAGLTTLSFDFSDECNQKSVFNFISYFSTMRLFLFLFWKVHPG